MEHTEAGWQTQEVSILCINNCGFFGKAETMNMCSKCHRDMISKQQQVKIAASSIESIMNCSGSNSGKEPVVSSDLDIITSLQLPALKTLQSADASISSEVTAVKTKEGPSRCSSCRKRVGLTGFTCRCGNIFCAMHRHSENHDCQYDYRESGRDAIAKANPVIKSDKLDRI